VAGIISAAKPPAKQKFPSTQSSERVFQRDMPKTLSIWVNTKLTTAAAEQLAAGVVPHKLLIAERSAGNLTAGSHDPLLAQADVAFGQPDPKQVVDCSGLKWIHLSSAGYTRYDRGDVKTALASRKAILTNSSSVFNAPCAEHVAAFMLAQARQLPAAILNQAGVRNGSSMPRAWISPTIRSESKLLMHQTAMIVGFGAIGKHLAAVLLALKMNVLAIRRQPHGDEMVPTHGVDEVDRLLPTVDHVINILPASKSTDGFFTAERIASMKPGSVFYNIGRGATVDQQALIIALQEKRLAAAYLDVTDPEPLPPEHPLWLAPNCHITPHTAGGHADEFERAVRHFLGNLRRYEKDEPLLDRVM